MAYTAGTLVCEYQGGPGAAKRYSYVTTDAFETVAADDYFLSDYVQLDIGDVIEVTVVDDVDANDRASVTNTGRLLITAATSSTVTAVTEVPSSAVVSTTATTLTLTALSHAGKVVDVNSAAPIAITLPQAIGSGAKYKIRIGVAATATSHTIAVANATDVMSGLVLCLTTSSDNVIGYPTTATSDTITLNGTTRGGVAGDWFEITDVATGVFSVEGRTQPTGTTATPFSAEV